jgi:type III secretion system needle length determinant
VLEEGKPQPAPTLLPLAGVAPPVEEAAPVRGALPVKDLDSLAREIGAAIRVNDGKEIEIRFDSKTLDGLEIRIRKEEGKLSVRMRSDSPQINQLLAGQSEALAQRLEASGYAGVRVEMQAEPRSANFTSSQGRGGARDDKGGQEQKDRQRQRQR